MIWFADRTGDAFANMADDLLLLEGARADLGTAVLFRHYGWERAAFTFGYGQRYAGAAGLVPPEVVGADLELCRRPTGGGLVDHRDDWTYTLVLPPTHPLHRRGSRAVYRLVHACLADVLVASGAPVGAVPCPAGGGGGVRPTRAAACFSRAEYSDVVRLDTGKKVAGAAMKLSRSGLLLQGSIARPRLPEFAGGRSWETLAGALAEHLADALGEDRPAGDPAPWPDFGAGATRAVVRRVRSDAWNRRR